MMIRSGEFGGAENIRDYRAEWLGGVFIERVIWGDIEQPQTEYGAVVADSGYIWFRFWLPMHNQVVERYYAPGGTLIGTKIDVCGPLACEGGSCWAEDWLLDLWMNPDEHVVVGNEENFERAIREGTLTPEDAARAEAHFRQLTAEIAKGRFPPPIVRNWQLDMKLIAEQSEGRRTADE